MSARGYIKLHPGRAHPGFTLIEVLLAIGIFSIVLVAINTVFFAALRLRQKTSDIIEETIPLTRSLATLRRDLQNAVAPGGVMSGSFRYGGLSSGTAANSTSKGAVSTIVGQTGSGLDFFTSTGLLSDDAPWGDIQEVNYQLMEPADRVNAYGRDLVRSVTRNLLSPSTQTADTQRLAGNVESLDFLFYDGTQWRDSWDTTAGDTTLPLAVRVRVQMASREGLTPKSVQPVEMVILFDTQTQTNQTQTSTGGTQ